MTEPLDLASTIQSLAKTKSDWLDSQMRRIMPPEVYALSKSDKGRDRMKLAKWMAVNKVSLIESCDGPESSRSNITMDGELISRFGVRIKDGKVETLVKDYPLPETEQKEPDAK